MYYTTLEQLEPLHEFLSQDSKLWTPQATAAIHGLVEHIIAMCRWLNLAPDQKVRMRTRVALGGMALVLLQRDPAAPCTWLSVSCLGRKLEALEQWLPPVVLELMMLHEAAWKMADVCAYVQPGQLAMAVSP